MRWTRRQSSASSSPKHRPHTDPLIVHIASLDQVPQVASSAPPVLRRLAAAFWPGPLTVVLPRGPNVAPNVSSGRSTVAVRIPAHAVALALMESCRLPIAAPSANLFSRPSPTTAAHVLEDLAGRVDIMLDGGSTPIGLESTVVDLTVDPPRLLRPGGVAAEALLDVLPTCCAARAGCAAAMKPRMRRGGCSSTIPPRRGSFWCGAASRRARQVTARLARLEPLGLRVGVLATAEDQPALADLPVELAVLGSATDLEAIGQALFAQLRALDGRGVHVILVRELPVAGLGLAIGDRLFPRGGGVCAGR